MRARIRRWGNSLGVRIPKSFALEIGVEPGSSVDLSVENGELVVRPLIRRHDLEALLAGVTRKNLHSLIEEEPVGREVW